MDPLDFLPIADTMQGSAAEAERRTSIGRSYYAVFNFLRGKVDPIKRVPLDDEAHRAIAQYLAAANNKELSSVGLTLNTLRTTRNTADYNMAATVSATEAQLAFQKARNAIAKFNSVSEALFAAALRAQATYQSRRP